MSCAQVALRYMQTLQAFRRNEASAEEFYSLCASDLTFITPHYQMSSAREYIESLQASESPPFSFSLLHIFENSDSACLIYYFSSSAARGYMSQTFEIRDTKITSILLIYDSSSR